MVSSRRDEHTASVPPRAVPGQNRWICATKSMTSPPTRPLTLRGLADALRDADPAALLVSARLLRRVIRMDRRISPLGFGVPHGDTYLIVRERLFDLVSHFELELDPTHRLPDAVLLIRRPDEEELHGRPASEVLFEYWRLLFHIRTHLELQRRVAAGQLTEDGVLDRLRRIGSPEYAEIRGVLQRDEMLLPPRTDLSTYVEFAATFLELRYFALEQLPAHFPALRDEDGICNVLAKDVDHRAVYDATRLAGAERPPAGTDQEAIPAEPLEPVEIDPLRPSPPAYWRLIARAERAGSVGNAVKAAILRYKASRVALPNHVDRMKSLAVGELKRLVGRLQLALDLNEEGTKRWVAALIPVLQHADRGFRTAEARLLYDLQKVCVEHETRRIFDRSVPLVPVAGPGPAASSAAVAPRSAGGEASAKCLAQADHLALGRCSPGASVATHRASAGPQSNRITGAGRADHHGSVGGGRAAAAKRSGAGRVPQDSRRVCWIELSGRVT